MGRAEKSELFAGEGQKQDAPLHLLLLCEIASQFDDAGRAGCVVIGTGMHLPGRAQRKLLAEAEVVVMRADHDIFVGVAGKIGGYVAHLPGLALDVHREIDLERVWKRERLRLEIFVDLFAQHLQILACGFEPGGRLFSANLHKRNAGIAGSCSAGKDLQLVIRALAVEERIHKDYGFGPVNLGVHGLVLQLRMGGVCLAFKLALFVELLRFLPQQQHDLALDVQARVVVIAVFRRRDAVARKHHLPRRLAALREVERHKIFAGFERLGLAANRVLQPVAGCEPGACGDGEGLAEGVGAGHGFESERLELFGDILGRQVELFGARAAAFQLL